MKKLLLISLLFVAGFAQAQAPWSTFIDSTRATNWAGGQIGFAIPNYTVACATQPTGLVANSTGAATANAAAINNSLASCDATHNVVNIPAGTYYYTSIRFGSQGKQVLRGAGGSTTTIIPTVGSNCAGGTTDGICMVGPNVIYNGSFEALPPSGTQQCTWTAGYTQNTTSITLNSCGGPPSVNKIMLLDQANDLSDTGGVYNCDVNIAQCGYEGSSGGNNNGRTVSGAVHSQQQVVKVTSVSGSGGGPYTVTISPGVLFSNVRTGQNPGAWWWDVAQNSGLENLTIDGGPMSASHPTDFGNIGMYQCYQCWVKGVRSMNAGRHHIDFYQTYQSVVRDNYFYGAAATGSESYSVEFAEASGNLVENNIFQHVTVPTMFGNGAGNVVGYNFSIYSSYGAPYVQQAYVSHNAGNNMNLFEGNDFLGIISDDAWGSSDQNTFFRNFLYGFQNGFSQNTIPIVMRDWSRVYNIVGNVMGTPGYAVGYQTIATSSSTFTGGAESTNIYSIGLARQDGCNASASLTVCDPVTASSLMRWGNYDTVNNTVRWDSTEAAPGAVTYASANFSTSYFNTLAHTLPASLYYTSTPLWWPSGKAWPLTGPDITTGNIGQCSGGTYALGQATNSSQCTGGTKVTAWGSHANSTPALDCYFNVMHGPPDGTGSALTFNALGCYSAAPPPPTLVSITVRPNPATVTTASTVSMQTGNTSTSTICTFSDASIIAAGSAGCVVAWTNTNVHSTVNPSTGVVSGVSVGSDMVTATLGSVTGTATVNVTATPTLQSITVLPPAGGYWIFSATNTGSLQLSVRCTYSSGPSDNCAAIGGVTWYSDYPIAATINSSGLLTGTGTPVPTASNPVFVNVVAYKGSIFGRARVNINFYALTCLLVRPETTGSNITLGSTILVSAIDCSPASGASSPTINGPAVGNYAAYTSSNTTIATVNNIGEVTAVGVGSATITATLPGVTATRVVTVTNPTIAGNTWYVREGGGTIKDAAVPGGQCDGTLNVDLAGSSGGHCAFNNPMYCFTDETSGSTYTGPVKGGDTCSVTPSSSPTGYSVVYKSPGVPWVTQQTGSILPPSGKPGSPTRLVGSNFGSCSTDAHHAGNRALFTSFGQPVFVLYDVQNFDVQCVDLYSNVDCNQGLSMNNLNFACPSGQIQQMAMIVDQFTSNFTMENVRVHGYYTGLDGTAGPGTVWTNTVTEFNSLNGVNLDNPYGYNGDRNDGFVGNGFQANSNGCTEEKVKTLVGGSVVRKGSGFDTVTFPAGSIVNYTVGNNIVLAGLTPGDLNGTFPVTSVNFNQATASITGGSITSYNDGYVSVWGAAFTTSSAPTFTLGSFVTISGASPAFLNGTYEVFSVSGTGFIVAASQYTHPGWTSGTISSGGTASTAVVVAAAAAGSSEVASVLGTASHVTPAHRCMDQGDTGYANGDGWGSGNDAIGSYQIIDSQFHRNTQDGYDGLHSFMTLDQVTGTWSEGNEGAPIKAGAADLAVVTNNLLAATAGANMAVDPNFPPEYNQYLTTFFRANDGFGTHNYSWNTMIVSNNTWEIGQNVFIDDNCDSPAGCQSLPFPKYVYQNNLSLGYQDLNNPVFNQSDVTLYYGGGSPYTLPAWAFTNNIAYKMRNPPAGGTGNLWNNNPGVITYVPNIPDQNLVVLVRVAARLPMASRLRSAAIRLSSHPLGLT